MGYIDALSVSQKAISQNCYMYIGSVLRYRERASGKLGFNGLVCQWLASNLLNEHLYNS